MSRSRLIALVTLVVAHPALAGSVPQMDKTWYANQLLWLAFSFLVLYELVARFVTPTLSQLLGTRASTIRESIKEAEKANRIATASRHESIAATKAANAKSASMRVQMQASLAQHSAKTIAQLSHDIKRKLDQADARIDKARLHALQQLTEPTCEVAASIIQKIIGVHVTPEEILPQVVDRFPPSAAPEGN